MSEDVRSTIQKRDEKGVVRHGGEWLAIWSDPDSVKSDAEKRVESAQSKKLRAIEASLAATARSLCGQDVEVVFGSGETSRKSRIVLPKLAPDGTNLMSLRGRCDASASILAYHDATVHAALAPVAPIEAKLFRLLENIRCEALEARFYPGVAQNLVALQIERLKAAQLLRAHLASLLPLAEALRMVCRDTFLFVPEPSIQTAGFRMWDRWLRDRFQRYLDEMAADLDDQGTFGLAARTFLAALLEELPSAGERERRDVSRSSDGGSGQERELRETDDPRDAPVFEPGELENEMAEDGRRIETARAPAPAPYHAFTNKYDRIVHASELEPASDLRKMRARLDERMSDHRREVTRLVSRLQRRLLALQARQWEFDLDEGLIDAAKLDRVIINPGFEHAYKQEFDSPFRDTLVTLLVDNSGSMRGRHVETACVVAELLSAALERCMISTEILGFTTSAWKGGQSYKDWLRAGKPVAPGRLNDLLHVVYKDAATPLRRARDSICAMLSPGLLKENVDGEALEWAAGRMLQRPERRRLLIVLSDGAPVDQATLERNEDKQILDRHLRAVIGQIQSVGLIELCAIGIGHDVSAYYPVSRQIDQVGKLADAVIGILDQLLVTGKARS